VPPSGALTVVSLLRNWTSVIGSGWARRVLAVGLLEGALMFGALAFVPTWLHERTGMSLAAAGGAVAALGLGGLAYTTNARRLIPLLGERWLLTAGGALIATGFVLLVTLAHAPADAWTWVAALGGCGVAGVGFYMLHSTMQTLATQLAPHARATAVGLFAVAIFVGQSIGVAVSAWLGPRIGHASVVVGAGLLMAALGAAMGRAVDRRRTVA
jgi:predicted MFS family arabinose efflux permease